jgi:DNA polymerase III subunit epsilon
MISKRELEAMGRGKAWMVQWARFLFQKPLGKERGLGEREVILDVETTGLSPRAGHRIVSIALLEIHDAAHIGRGLEFRLDPERGIPLEAAAIHGMKTADVRNVGLPRFADVAQDILSFIGGSRLVGYHLAFDLDFLASELARAELEGVQPVHQGLDVMRMFKRQMPGLSSKLFAACAVLGIDVSGCQAHSAMGDAVATAKLYAALRSRTTTASWQGLVETSRVALVAYQAEQRSYLDDDLQAAWELFEAKDYAPALAHAMAAVERDAAAGGSPDGLCYELASFILRRCNRNDEDRDLLMRFFRRALGPDVTPKRIEEIANQHGWAARCRLSSPITPFRSLWWA